MAAKMARRMAKTGIAGYRRKGPYCANAAVRALRNKIGVEGHRAGVVRVDLQTCKATPSRNLAVVNKWFPTRGFGGHVGELVLFEPDRIGDTKVIVDAIHRGRTQRFAAAWADAGMAADWICKRVGVTKKQRAKLAPHISRLHGGGKAAAQAVGKCFLHDEWTRARARRKK